MYRLESAGRGAQWRYEFLCSRLNDPDYLATRKTPRASQVKSASSPQCREAILSLLVEEGSLSAGLIVSSLSHIYMTSCIRASIRYLRKEGSIVYSAQKKRYAFIEESNPPLEVGMPIVFMPGLRSQDVGEIVEMKELRTSPGQLHPVARLGRSGRLLFVQADTAKVDLSEMADNRHETWLLEQIKGAGTEGICRADLSRLAFHNSVPRLSELITKLVKAEKIWVVKLLKNARAGGEMGGSLYLIRKPGGIHRVSKERAIEAMAKYPSQKDAAKSIGIAPSAFSFLLKTYGLDADGDSE
jgi:hypothetical protein